MAEPVDIPFAIWILVGPMKHVLHGCRIRPSEEALLGDIVGHARRSTYSKLFARGTTLPCGVMCPLLKKQCLLVFCKCF